MEYSNFSESKKEFNNDDFDESYNLIDNYVFDFLKNEQKETRIFEFNRHSNNNTGNQTISLTFLNSFKNQNLSTTKKKRKKKNKTEDKLKKKKKKKIKDTSNNEKRTKKKFRKKKIIVIDDSSLDTTIPNDKMKIENNL